MQPRNAGSPCRPWAIISPFVSNRAQLKSQASVTMREKAVRSSVTCASSTMASSLFHHMVSVVASSAGVCLADIVYPFSVITSMRSSSTSMRAPGGTTVVDS